MNRQNRIGMECYPGGNGFKDILLRGNYISRKPIYDFYVEKLSQVGGVILDFGCGNMPYKELCRGANKYIGLDVDTAKEYGFEENGVVYYDGKDIPLDDGTVDCVIAAQVFEHIEDLEYSMNEIQRILKGGGILCFSVPMAYPIHYDPYDFQRFTVYGLQDMLKRHDFKEVEIRGSNSASDTVAFIKILNMRTPLRKLYIPFVNIKFIYTMRRGERLTVRIENMIRQVLGKRKRVDDFLRFPLDYLVWCRKGFDE